MQASDFKNFLLVENDLAELMIEIPGMDFDNMRNLSLNLSDRKELLAVWSCLYNCIPGLRR